MITGAEARTRWIVVFLFAVAMAWVESACVYYLRLLVDRVNPYQPNPLPIRGALGAVELVREAATLIMLFAVGTLAGRTWKARFGYAAVAFGTWDIFYYIFLRVMCGWPRSLFDWDILFLLPLPWWGPVLAPVSIALLMIVWGTNATRFPQPRRTGSSLWIPWSSTFAGIATALYVFMADALHHVYQHHTVSTQLLPTDFNWPLFCAALAMMAAPLAATSGLRVHRGRTRSPLQPVE
jgi:hypothetical protein